MAQTTLDTIRETMTLEELAARLGIGMTKAYELAKRDALPVPRLPIAGPYRFSRIAYEELMSRQHDPAGTDAA